VSVSREEMEKRLRDFGCRYRADLGGGMDMWETEWGMPFYLQRDRHGRYSDVACNNAILLVFKETPFEWKVRKEFGAVWASINGLDQEVGRLRGELKRR